MDQLLLPILIVKIFFLILKLGKTIRKNKNIAKLSYMNII